MNNQKLPEGWKEVTLSEVCEVKKGTSITKDKVTKGNVPVIAGGQQPAYYHNVSNRTGETITVSGSGAYAGFVAYFNTPIFASDCSTIQSKNKEVFTKYIYYFLKGNQKKIYDLQRGIAQPHVYPKDLAILKIPLFPLETQKAIVSILEKAEKAKEWRKEADELTKDFLKSVFLEMFGNPGINPANWPIKLVEEIAEDGKSSIKAGPFGSSLKKEFYVEKGYKVYGQEQVIRDNLTYGDYYIDEERYKKLENCKVQSGDVLISLVGSYGHISIVPEKFEPGIINPRLMKITLNKDLLIPIFFKKLLLTKNIKTQIKNFSHGGTMNIVNVGIMKKIKIPVPPIELQNKFASIVKEVEAMKEQQKHSKEQINNLFNALMQKVFKGGLVA